VEEAEHFTVAFSLHLHAYADFNFHGTTPQSQLHSMSCMTTSSCPACRLSLFRKAATAVERLQEKQLQQLGGPRPSSRLQTPLELHKCQISTIRSHADALVAQMQSVGSSGRNDSNGGHVQSGLGGGSHHPDSSCAHVTSVAEPAFSHGVRVKALAAIEAAHRLRDLADSIEEASRGGWGGGGQWHLQARASLRLAAEVSASCAAARCGVHRVGVNIPCEHSRTLHACRACAFPCLMDLLELNCILGCFAPFAMPCCCQVGCHLELVKLCAS
jgi:hypothetical protein